jgi:Lysyl oxidase/Bacterial Ig domain
MWIPRPLRAAVLAIATALLAPAAAPAQSSPELLPDLVADPPGSPSQPHVERLGDGRDYLLVRFDGTIHNAGRGPLEIRGSDPANGVMSRTWQRIFRADSSFRDDHSRHPTIRYENADGHRHWHLMGAARYSLRSEGDNALVTAAAKVGFCLLDSERVDGFGPTAKVYTRAWTRYCGEGQPTAADVREGISAGWRDLYPDYFPFQWVDVSDVAPGRYRIAAEVDPDGFVIESNESNNGPALAPEIVTVPGHVALPRVASGAGAHTIALGAQAYGNPRPAAFAIDSPPSHGTLNVAPGTPFAAAQVVYTPQAGFAGTDVFTYTARDPASTYPLRPRAAAVTITVPVTLTRHGATRLLARVRFSRRGRFLYVRGRALRSGVLRIVVRKSGRRLGSCRRRARAGRRFSCRIKLRRHASARRAKAVVTLLVGGRARAVQSFRVPRRL